MEEKGIDRHHHQSAMNHMRGAIGRLLPKLGDLLKQVHNLRTTTTRIKKYIKALDRQLRRMENALLRMPRAQQYWSYELKELPYDVEDIVDSLMLIIDKGKEQVTRPTIISKTLMKNIEVRVKNLAAWRAANFVPTTRTRTVELCLEDRFKQVRQLVGIHKVRTELISRMSSSTERLEIVSILGIRGMGKTTLVKAVYENIKGNFQYTAFLSIGRQPDLKKALTDILIHLDKQKYSDTKMTVLDEGQLIHELRHFLKNKRYLIVIDDIWDRSSWEIIKHSLVENNCGSRIITTSRLRSVAESSDEVFVLESLTVDQSKELFYAILLCGRKGPFTFDQMVEQSTEYILQKCDGVPLAIIVIASLLASKPQEEWTDVYKSIGFGHEDNNTATENIRKIIQFCYDDLPSHLKTCLLYLSIFPDDYEIEKDTVIWRWVAEGFVHDEEEQGESLFKVGERYWYELVSRSMIQEVENKDTQICGCRVEGMVLDIIRIVAKEQSFVNIASEYGYGGRSNKAHIVAVHNRVLDEPYLWAEMWKQKVRSFNATDCSISSKMLLQHTIPPLRVLSLEGCKLTSHSENLIHSLLHLRFLGLEGTNIEYLPVGIGGLRYLQTLDLTETSIRELPSSVTQLRQLKCLRCLATWLELPEGMGNLTSLEELQLGVVGQSLNFGKELRMLTELRVLHIVNKGSFNSKWMEALVESLCKLQKIEELGLFCYWRSSKNTCRHVIAPGAFPKMRHFRANTWMMYQPGAMRCLKSVEVEVDVRAFNDANFDFNDFYKLSYLCLLEKVHVAIVCSMAKMEEAEEVEAALRRVLESHPNHPKFILTRLGRCVDDKQVEFEDDKQIRFLGGLHGSEVAPQAMPLELLRKITNNFSEKQRLGTGAFGTVYKGVLNGKEVAVKLLHHSMSPRLNYEEEFTKEFENLRRLNHPNTVQLLGYCYETKRVAIEHNGNNIFADQIDRALCFDYMHNGNLQRHLDGESHGLNWQTRYKIIKGICEGLKYLHKGLENPMFHLDLKPGNILLDKNMVPKLADFGLSRLVCDNQTQHTSNFLGTIRYCPPEHIEGYYFSDKFDIFSLGVVMIEIIVGPESYYKTFEMSPQEFVDHVQENWTKRIHRETPGSTLPNYECHQVKRCIEIALECVRPKRTQRPDIEDIISRLNETENSTEKTATTSSSQNEA